MAKWKLHVPDEGSRIGRYKCGLVAGERLRLRKELVVRDHKGEPTGEVHPGGEEWTVLAGVSTDPVVQFRQPDGQRHIWDDDLDSIHEWFEAAGDAGGATRSRSSKT